MGIEPLNVEEVKKEEQVLIYFEQKKFGPVPKNTPIETVREALQKDYPEAANAKITQDPSTGDFTVTRSAGEKGR